MKKIRRSILVMRIKYYDRKADRYLKEYIAAKDLPGYGPPGSELWLYEKHVTYLKKMHRMIKKLKDLD